MSTYHYTPPNELFFQEQIKNENIMQFIKECVECTDGAYFELRKKKSDFIYDGREIHKYSNFSYYDDSEVNLTFKPFYNHDKFIDAAKQLSKIITELNLHNRNFWDKLNNKKSTDSELLHKKILKNLVVLNTSFTHLRSMREDMLSKKSSSNNSIPLKLIYLEHINYFKDFLSKVIKTSYELKESGKFPIGINHHDYVINEFNECYTELLREHLLVETQVKLNRDIINISSNLLKSLEITITQYKNFMVILDKLSTLSQFQNLPIDVKNSYHSEILEQKNNIDNVIKDIEQFSNVLNKN